MTDFHISERNIAAYLSDNDVIRDDVEPTVTSLGGGVSNTVLQVSTPDACYVVKQPLANLAVEDDWPADTARVHNEAAAVRAYHGIIDAAGLDDIEVSAVVFEDTENRVIAITCAPATSRMWKAELLERHVDPDVGATLGRFLATSHRDASEKQTIRSEFANKTPFEQLRLDPYHRTVAEQHPDIRAVVDAEIERISDVERTLVHGDFSPKNVLVDSADETPVWLLDFEVAHWGDPSFDTAFMLNHLCIKAVYNPGRQQAYLETATHFWEAYTDVIEWDIEADTVTELAILMLARVDGKSPVEYVTSPDTKEILRRIAKRALTEDVATVPGYLDLLTEVADA
ncbi:aminoglycoside phosphotransferase family protein [Halopenitus sp. H-Gu1]|uniref:aminoglycoside phosphotransferase family protein n=1 Tax=Halopenitus sp. H-Gu1 TaxID=3242697 RepID=UPI00359E6525